jgi:NADPH-dependent curcumin reductase CurA
MPIAAAPPPAQVASAPVDSGSRSAVVCVRAAGPRPLFFNGKLVAKKPGSKPPGDFELPLRANVDQCNNLLRSKVADWTLSVTTPGFTACKLAAPEFGYRVTYSAKAGARGLTCAQIAKSPIGTWK